MEASLPVVPPPCPDERLQSWLARIADVYLVSVNELQTHVGWSQPAAQLELAPDHADIECIARATNGSVRRIIAMTFEGAPLRHLKLVRQDSLQMCPACSPGLAPPQRLKVWAFAFSFWCDRHRRLLYGSDARGIGVLGNEAAARRGAGLLHDWTMGRDAGAISVEAAVSLLLSSCRKPSPPAPWELARLSEAEWRSPPCDLARPCRRPALGVIVPEFNTAMPIYDQRVPRDIFALRDAPLAVRYAVAIGLARLLNSPADATSRILAGCDASGRKRITAQIDRWPLASRRFFGVGRPLKPGRQPRTRSSGSASSAPES